MPAAEPDTTDILLDTKLYRYLSVESFDRFLAEGISLTRMSTWPDRFESADFAFVVNAHRLGDPRPKRNFFASCWTLEREDYRHFDDAKSFALAQSELEHDGSASMWEAYCAKGGVRICTTLSKLKRIFEERFPGRGTVYHGEVNYLAARDPHRVVGKSALEETLMYKRIGYRSESEYRFVAYDEREVSDFLMAPIDDYYSFLDEILVFPLKGAQTNALANSLHAKGAGIATGRSIGTNTKNGDPFCRVSQLYGLASQSIGDVHYVRD